MMKDISLLDKSEENCKTAEWAEKNKYFNSATSRYYYSLFQKIIYLLVGNTNIKTYNDEKISHQETINNFIGKYYSQLSPEQNHRLTYLHKLRKNRNIADYTNNSYENQTEFEKTFKCLYNETNRVLGNIISKEDKKG